MSAITDWLATRPAAVQQLAADFPPLSQVELGGMSYFVIGYDEDIATGASLALVISPFDPRADYDVSMAFHRHVCADQFRPVKP